MSGTATSASTIPVEVTFASTRILGVPTSVVSQVYLTLDGREVGRYRNSPFVRQGSTVFVVDLATVAEGSHTLRAYANQFDGLTLLRGESRPVQLIVDRTGPVITITEPLAGQFVSGSSVVVRGTVEDLSGVASLSCAGNAVAVASPFTCEVPVTPGANEIVVTATDRGGNSSERRVSFEHFVGGLSGLAGDPALDRVVDVFTPDERVQAGEITNGVVRTQIELVFARDATVGAVNGLLQRLNARIVSQLEGVLIALVRIPDPGTLEALDALIVDLNDEPVLRGAHRALMSDATLLPQHVQQAQNGQAVVRHHLAVGAHAAWNARDALRSLQRPTLVVGDSFGAGAPSAAEYTVIDPSDFVAVNPEDHGYMVLGVAAGAFDPGAAANPGVDAITGLFPGPLPLRGVDEQAGLAIPAIENQMLRRVIASAGNVVVNTSLGFPCGAPEDAARNCTRENAGSHAVRWIEKVRGTAPCCRNLEGRFLHATGGGNIADGVTRYDANVASPWTAAALLPLVDPRTGQTVPNLANTLVVENFASTDPLSLETERIRPECPSPTSALGGNIAAIGSPDINSFSASSATVYPDGGTSAATPQVSGLAAYVWTLRPSLTPAGLVTLLQRTARPTAFECDGARVIDAYAAVLAADEGNTTRPARMAVLDVNNSLLAEVPDGVFDDNDLLLFIQRLGEANGAIDYSRYDLNGSGTTGSDENGVEQFERFDLNVDGSYGVVSLDIEDLTLRFDESGVSDQKVLCHSAYSALYASNDAAVEARDDLLGLPGCLNLHLDVTFPSTVEPGVSNSLIIRALDLDLPEGADFLGQEGVRLELAPIGGSVADVTGITNSDGSFVTSATLLAGESELFIDIVARSREGGPELARTTVRAVAATAPVEILSEGTLCNLGLGSQCPQTVSNTQTQGALTFNWSMTATPSISTTFDGGTLVISGNVDMTGVASISGFNEFGCCFHFDSSAGGGPSLRGAGSFASFTVRDPGANVCLDFNVNFENTGGGGGIWRQLGRAHARLSNTPAGQDGEAVVDLILETGLVSDSDALQGCFFLGRGNYDVQFSAGMLYTFDTNQRGELTGTVNSHAVSSGSARAS